jgi:hypothetical protein
MEAATRRHVTDALRSLGWWALFLVVAMYGVFALATGVSELLFLAGLAAELKHRATPIVFSIHAIAGTLVLFIGPLQSVRWIRARARVRRALGRTYVFGVWIASVTAIVDAIAFGVSVPAKAVFVAFATLWFITAAIGMRRARARQAASKHEWMIRSYALALFFVSFSLWVPALAATPLPANVAYPLALLLSGAVNLAVAEVWIRRTRVVRVSVA